nr:hypothetical protein B0A51_11547 [Rachicladosporium sp. CCFEE 5018]
MEKTLAQYNDDVAKDELSTVAVTGNVELVDRQGHIRRIPVPSSDPNDPLNFSKWRKAGALFTLPLSMVFGRRPVMLGCCCLLLGSTVGAAMSNNINAHMAARICQGLATGATESVLPLIISDISFIDERGLLFGIYWGTQNLIGTVFTITVSYLVADRGWRWFYWLLTILCAFGTLLIILFLPETRYNRSPLALAGQVIHTDEFGVTTVLSDDEARVRFGTTMTVEQTEYAPQRSYLQSLNPVNPVAPHPIRLMLSALAKMAASLSSPAVVWAILATSITLGTTIALSLTYGSILTEGFGWSQAEVGLVNCGIIPISFAAMFFAGYLGDKLNLFLAKRRGGEHKPEHSLITLIFPTIVSALAIVVYAVTANNPARYSSWGIIMGWTLFQFGFIVCLITTTHFAAEAYPHNPGPALVTVVGLKNIVSFGASFGLVPMVHRFGNYLTPYMILFGIFCGIYLLGIPVYFLNPKVCDLDLQRDVAGS